MATIFDRGFGPLKWRAPFSPLDNNNQNREITNTPLDGKRSARDVRLTALVSPHEQRQETMETAVRI